MATRRVVALDRFGPPSVMRWTEAPMPPRGERDVLVAVDAIGVNFADTMVRRGEYRRDQSLDFTPGFEVAGRVVDGPADGPEPGRLVVAFTEHGGGYADHVAVPLDHVLTSPRACARRMPRRCSRRASPPGTPCIATAASPRARRW